MTKPIAASEFQIAPPEPVAAARPNALRKRLLIGLAGVVALGIAGYVGYSLMVGSQQVSTDNAYVGADAAQVAPQVAGPVRQVLVSETQQVAKGQVLVVLDDTDARLELAEAQAARAQAERKVRGYFASDQGLAAQVAARSADQASAAARTAAAQSDLDRAGTDLQRRKALAATGAVSGEELTSAQNAFEQARAALQAARAAQAAAAANRAAAVGTLGANHVLTAGSGVADNPEVAAARARESRAWIDLERTVIRAPVAGVVASRKVQLGQRVQPGAPLMTIVPVQSAFVDANFKEGQLRKVQPGEPVELESDLYGSKVKYHGKVVGLSGGAGSAFAMIPAQNATGNWIKVVQRVPVRIALDPAELKAHPLRIGLSMKAVIHTGR